MSVHMKTVVIKKIFLAGVKGELVLVCICANNSIPKPPRFLEMLGISSPPPPLDDVHENSLS